MMNFCLQPFIAHAAASCIHQDGYEVDNLFSFDPQKNQRGYQIERFVRPPVSIDITFLLPVDVHYIIIHVGLQESEKCKVEFFVTREDDSNNLRLSPCHKLCGSFVLTVPLALSVFHNPNHLDSTLPNKVLGSQVCERLVCQQITSQPLKLINMLTTTTKLTICVKYFSGHRALSIKSLEVWGQPSQYCNVKQLKCFESAKESLRQSLASQKQCSSSLVKSIYTTPGYLNANSDVLVGKEPILSTSNTGTQAAFTCNKKETSSRSEKEKPCIPEQFLDKLTFEMMVVPISLPSGYHVDQTTVDKCRDTDLLYGRQPSDPFTGLPYTETKKPVFCAQLKADIDDYVACKSSRPSRHGSTAGSANEIVHHRLLIG